MLSKPIKFIRFEAGLKYGYMNADDLKEIAKETSVRFEGVKNKGAIELEVRNDNSLPLKDSLDLKFKDDALGDDSTPNFKKLWTRYPGSDDWLCWTSTERPPVEPDSDVCSWCPSSG